MKKLFLLILLSIILNCCYRTGKQQNSILKAKAEMTNGQNQVHKSKDIFIKVYTLGKKINHLLAIFMQNLLMIRFLLIYSF